MQMTYKKALRFGVTLSFVAWLALLVCWFIW